MRIPRSVPAFASSFALAFAIASVAAPPAHAQTTVHEPWVRGTVAQQKATGLFARITSATDAKLVAASSPVAGTVEIHQMLMEGNVMRMRQMQALELPAGRPVELKPGGYHVMLLDLKRALQAGENVPVTLVVEHGGGRRESVEIVAPVRALGAMPQMGTHRP